MPKYLVIIMLILINYFVQLINLSPYNTTYEPVANAIECSKVGLVFLNAAFQVSNENRLVFEYAVKRGKAFIFVLVEKDLDVEAWIEPHLNDSPKYEFYVETSENTNAEFELRNSLARPDLKTSLTKPYDESKSDALIHAIKQVGSAQPSFDKLNYTTDELIRLKELLDDALDELSEKRYENIRSKTCTRCGREFDVANNYNLECPMHTGFFVEDSIYENKGHWICCNAKEKDSIGCKNDYHTLLHFRWVLDPRYGTYTWEVVE